MNGHHRTKKNAQAILDRLARLEQSQQDLMARLQTSHESQMASLRGQLQQAQQRCVAANDAQQLIAVEPVLMQVDMTEVEAAVQAASYAEQESAQALEEARQVAEQARIASGVTIPSSVRDHALQSRADDAMYDADHEYILKKVCVNLDEVERVINASTYVHVCRAFGLPDPKYGNEVFCAVVPKKHVKVSEPMLFIHAQKYLPTAMVPKRFYFVPELPLGITRKALADTHMAGELDVHTNGNNPTTSSKQQYLQQQQQQFLLQQPSPSLTLPPLPDLRPPHSPPPATQ